MNQDNGDSYDVTREDLPAPQLSGHMWKQYGNKIECNSCPTKHVAFLQVGTFISGYKDGVPIISQIVTRQVGVHPQPDESVSTS